MDVDENFIDVFQMKILAGRGFSTAFKGDSSNYVVNEKALQIMGMKVSNAVGKGISFAERKGTIIGVVKDFNFKPLQYAIEPLVLRLNRDGGIVVLRTQPGNTEATINTLGKISRTLNPAYPFSYNFLDKDLDNQYRGEQRMGSIFNLFAILAIFISCSACMGYRLLWLSSESKKLAYAKYWVHLPLMSFIYCPKILQNWY